MHSVQRVSKTLFHKRFTFTKHIGYSKGGLDLIQKYLYFDPYQRYEETFASSLRSFDLNKYFIGKTYIVLTYLSLT